MNAAQITQYSKNIRIAVNDIPVPRIDLREFDLFQINDAMKLVAGGHINGKVIVRFS